MVKQLSKSRNKYLPTIYLFCRWIVWVMAVSVAFKSNKTFVQKDVTIPHGEFHLGERVGQLAEARIPLLASGWRTGNTEGPA